VCLHPFVCWALQETLAANFEGTRKVLELAAAAVHLKALVHVSSAFVNMNQPRSSVIDEQLYPLKYGHQTVDVEELARVSATCAAVQCLGSEASDWKPHSAFWQTCTVHQTVNVQNVALVRATAPPGAAAVQFLVPLLQHNQCAGGRHEM
jgi:hypothetical protein